MTTISDCLGRIYRPLENCISCKKDEGNLRCPCYQPHNPIELIDIGPDEYGEQGASVPKRLDDRAYMDEVDRRNRKVSE